MREPGGDPTVTYAGWTYKEGSLVKNWKKRFLVVKRRELAYYKTTDHTSHHAQLMGGMRIARVEMTAGITNGLRITGVEGRELKIFMDTADERDRCYNAIVEWCHPGGASATATASGGRLSSSSSATVPAPSFRGAPPPSTSSSTSTHVPSERYIGSSGTQRMAGWLEKQGQNMPTWKRRYFVLEDGILAYSTQEGKPSLGRHRVLGVRRDRTRPFTLELTLDTGRELRVSATNEHDLGDWQRALLATIQVSPAHRRVSQSTDGSDGRFSEPRPLLHEPQDSFNLFGAPPVASGSNITTSEEDARRSANMSFGNSIRLDFDGDNTSFIEVSAPPAVKPWSPTAPGAETIRQMRIAQNLLDSDDEDDFELTTATTTTTTTSTSGDGTSSPVPSFRPRDKATRLKQQEAAGAGAGQCCCIVM